MALWTLQPAAGKPDLYRATSPDYPGAWATIRISDADRANEERMRVIRGMLEKAAARIGDNSPTFAEEK